MNRAKKIILTGALTVAMAFAAVGCGASGNVQDDTGAANSGDSNGDITIAVAGPMTGDGAQYGKAFKEGAELAVEQFNAAGGYNGRKVKVIYGDDKNDPKEAANVAQNLSSNKDVVAVIGHWSSSATFAGIPIYQRNQVPMLAPTASTPSITKPETTWIFRSTNTQDTEGKNLADYAVNKLNKKKIAVLYLNSDWGKANAEFFKTNVEKLGGTIVSYESYPSGQNLDYSASLTKVKGLNPDLLYIGSTYSDGVLIIKQAKAMNLNIPIMGPTTLASDGFLQAKDAVEGVYLDSAFFPQSDRPEVQKFVSEFQQKYNHIPGTFNALCYDATNIVLESIKRGGPTRQGIRDAMAKIANFPVVTGTVTFNEIRSDNNKTYSDLVVKDGKFVLFH